MGKDSRSIQEAEWTRQGERLDSNYETEFSRVIPRIQLMARHSPSLRMKIRKSHSDMLCLIYFSIFKLKCQAGSSSKIESWSSEERFKLEVSIRNL